MGVQDFLTHWDEFPMKISEISIQIVIGTLGIPTVEISETANNESTHENGGYIPVDFGDLMS